MVSIAASDTNPGRQLRREEHPSGTYTVRAIDCADVMLSFGDRRILDRLRFGISVGRTGRHHGTQWVRQDQLVAHLGRYHQT